MTDANAAGERIGELLGGLSEETAALVREELENVRQQVATQMRRSAAGIGMLAVAGVFGGLALGTGTAALVRALDRVLPGRLGAGFTTLLYGGLAAGMTAMGVEQLRRHATEVPAQAAAVVREDVDRASSQAHEAASQT